MSKITSTIHSRQSNDHGVIITPINRLGKGGTIDNSIALVQRL